MYSHLEDEKNHFGKKRKNHFMKISLLKSQFNTLEEPSNSLTIDINKNPKEIISIITKKIFY